ncbi:hypothetical protein TRIUR3_19538 [Triticum urartu]|uniref:Uncharacterized protein n=1 Tax=Triticum urartu TaxID=4572 RepID=M7YYD9_TRIUA|nr:hypothetical protein TRIUR3_19538 [Triticum urartu]
MARTRSPRRSTLKLLIHTELSFSFRSTFSKSSSPWIERADTADFQRPLKCTTCWLMVAMSNARHTDYTLEVAKERLFTTQEKARYKQ